MNRRTNVVLICLVAYCLLSCNQDGLLPDQNKLQFAPKLSAYSIFKGNASRLKPVDGYEEYQLSTELFSDYAKKQRLIKIPAGTRIRPIDDRLPEFPDSTVIVKTFYYYNDERDTTKGKRLLETRLLVKGEGVWNVATYVWNDLQNEALLQTAGMNKTVNWIDEKGRGNVIAYHVPSNRECATCHNSSKSVQPLGPKLRNLNRDVMKSSGMINQLVHLNSIGMMDAVDPNSIAKLPAALNRSLDIDARARAYFDVNCAHCHNRNGDASETRLYFSYENSFDETGIARRARAIPEVFERGRMPKLGTTVVHDDGLELIKEYIESLH